MENTIIILAEIVYAAVVTLKTGKSKIKLHLKDAIKQVLHGEEIMSKDVFIFPSQLYDAFFENVPMNVIKLTTVDLTDSLRGAKLLLESTLTDDEEYTNFTISKLMIQDRGIDSLEEASVMASLDAKSREKRAERKAAKDKAATKEAMAAMAAEFSALEESSVEATEETPAPATEAPVEPELTTRQIAARKAAETRRRNRLAAEAAQA